MASGPFCGLAPLIFREKSFTIRTRKGSSGAPTKSLPQQVKSALMENSVGLKELNPLMELRKKITTFRDIIDLPSCNGSDSVNQLVIGTMADLQNLYPEIIPRIQYSKTKKNCTEQDLFHFCVTLKSIGNSWMLNHDWRGKPKYNLPSIGKDINSKKLVDTALEILDCLTAMARKRFDVIDEDDQKELSSGEASFNESSSPGTSPGCNSSSLCSSPITPISVLPHYQSNSAKTKETAQNIPHNSSSLQLSLRVQSIRKLNQLEVKHLSLNMLAGPESTRALQVRCNGLNDSLALSKKTKIEEVQEKVNCPEEDELAASDVDKTLSSPGGTKPMAPPPPQPLKVVQAQGRTPPPQPLKVVQAIGPLPLPPAMPIQNGAAPPPPPPLGAAKTLRAKATKLKRSSHMGNLYRTLKGKVEGSTHSTKSTAGRKGGVECSTRGKLGMADALAEMTKRSAYFQQIEEDVQKYAESITELKSKITSFQSEDMNQLLKFHKHVESVLEHLTDETQVLARFEEFPVKKLETIRTASALYSKLNAIMEELQNWKIVPPLGAVLDNVERYFSKIKGEIDALERTKDTESKKFQSQNIQFDFTILVRIKEFMVDVSSSCMELALKERREAKAVKEERNGRRKEGCGKMLWRAFQFAFRVYSFAGGHDDRAETLTRELAHEIETDQSLH